MSRQFNTRFAERPLNERPVEPLCRAVQDDSSRRELAISDHGMAMLAALVGKKIPQAMLLSIAASLQDILDGNGGFGSRHGSLLTEVYGEMIGPLVTCLERSGDFEVIRLLWSRREKRPDVLIVDKGSGKAILQECKATCCTVDDHDLSIDVCADVRVYKREGARQLAWPGVEALSGNRVTIAPVSDDLTCLLECNEKCVVVTAIPDGEIRRFRRSIESPREACPGSCAEHCLYGPEPHIVTALFSEQWDGDESMPDALVKLLANYKATERAAWGGAHGCFSNLYSNVLASYADLSQQQETDSGRTSLAPFLVGPLEYAVQNRLYVDIQQVGRACSEYLRGPLQESVFRTVHELAEAQGDIEGERTWETSARRFHSMVTGAEEHESDPLGNWMFHSRSPETGEEGHGTAVEAQVSESLDGYIDITYVPTSVSDENTSNDIQWALAETIGGEYAGDLYHLFEEEVVTCRSSADGEQREFALGRVLHLPWWPWPIRRAQLERMRNCCPWCNDMAHFIECQWREPFFDWHRLLLHHREHRHYHPYCWGQGGPTAYVTTDGRGVLRLPNWYRERQ